MKKIFIIGAILFCLTSCEKSLKTIVKEAEEATFIVYTYDEYGSPAGSASGFFIDANGTGITNYHVLNGAVKAFIKTADEQEYEIDRVLVSDKDWDVVKFTVKADSRRFKPLSFSKKKIEKGDVVYNISSPMGLEKTVSNGIVSSLREDHQHGEIVQITAPISPGSSGSPILDNNGDVFAVATFVRRGGQNLNFGVLIDDSKISALTKNDYAKANPKFNSKSDFVILNLPSDNGADITLNAIEFNETATTVYMSYTHLNLVGGGNYLVWCELNKKDKGFTLEDIDKKTDYYVTSSTIGVDKKNATEIELATTIRFKIFLPAIKNVPKNISVYGCGKDDHRWLFKNIDLDKYKNNINVKFVEYNRDYAMAVLRDGAIVDAQSILQELLENDPNDIIALNTMGVIAYSVDNNSDAIAYFSQAIENSPNDELAYVNRHAVYKSQKRYKDALEDINKAISVNPDQPDNYMYRAYLYMITEDWKNAKTDLDKALESDDFKTDPYAYLYRVYVNAYLQLWKEACKDIYTAFNLTDDKDLEKELQEHWIKCGCK